MAKAQCTSAVNTDRSSSLSGEVNNAVRAVVHILPLLYPERNSIEALRPLVKGVHKALNARSRGNNKPQKHVLKQSLLQVMILQDQ